MMDRRYDHLHSVALCSTWNSMALHATSNLKGIPVHERWGILEPLVETVK